MRAIFYSRLPIVTPSILLSLIVLVPLTVWTVVWGRANRAAWIAIGFLAVPIALSNQQVVTGIMISARDWERYINSQFLFLGLAFVIALLSAGRSQRFLANARTVGVVVTIALTVLTTRAQANSYKHWIEINAMSVAMARALAAVSEKAPDVDRLLLNEPFLAPLLAARTRDRFKFVLDYVDTFLTPVPHMGASGPPARSPLESGLFEHWWRTGTSTEEAREILASEALKRGGYYSGFLYGFRDHWAPASDNRAVRQDDIRRNIAPVIERYREYVVSGHATTKARPVIVLTTQEPALLRTHPALSDRLLATGQARNATIYAYLQQGTE